MSDEYPTVNSLRRAAGVDPVEGPPPADDSLYDAVIGGYVRDVMDRIRPTAGRRYGQRDGGGGFTARWPEFRVVRDDGALEGEYTVADVAPESRRLTTGRTDGAEGEAEG